jgi:hypothetical protein
MFAPSRSMPSLDDLRLIHAYCAYVSFSLPLTYLRRRYSSPGRRFLFSARVTTLEIENQLRSRQIPYHLVTPQPSPPLDLTFSTNLFPTELPVNLSSLALPAVLQTQQPTSSSSASSNQNSLAAAIPIISVQTSDLFRALPAAVDIALPHVSMRVANWWKAGDKCQVRCFPFPRLCYFSKPFADGIVVVSLQVITSVKLRHKPTLAGEQSSSTSTSSPSASSKHVIVDPLSSVVSFISEDINECVDSLTEEFGRVGKLAVIASESKPPRSLIFPAINLNYIVNAYTSSLSLSQPAERPGSPHDVLQPPNCYVHILPRSFHSLCPLPFFLFTKLLILTFFFCMFHRRVSSFPSAGNPPLFPPLFPVPDLKPTLRSAGPTMSPLTSQHRFLRPLRRQHYTGRRILISRSPLSSAID